MLRFVISWVLVASGCRTSAVPPTSAPELASCPSPPPSYRADVVPVLRQKCFACHAGDGDEVEDHDFSSFAKVRAQRASIEGKVRARAMPPSGRQQLTDPERQTLLWWLSCHAPEN